VESHEDGQEKEVILLDTQAMVWLNYQPDKLSRPAASAIRRARLSDGLAISAISLWEFAWILNAGILTMERTVEATVEEVASFFSVRPITPKIAAQASQFGPDFPKDPADRLISATALAEGFILVTSDTALRRSPYIRTIW
jgi:PIN domain nuclease of toxin-antitoxin system